MGDVTRNLLPYAVGRNVVESVTLIILVPFPLDDGSFDFEKTYTPAQARVVALTPDEIERLAAGGITLKKGVSVALTGELEKAPDQVIRADGTILKVREFTIEEGATILLADIPPLGADGPSYGSGYNP